MGIRFKTSYVLLVSIFLSSSACSTLGILEAQIGGRSDGAGEPITARTEREQDATTLPANPCETVLSADEQRLYRLITDYRKSKGLPPIPLSPSLSFVAKTHVRDLQVHPPAGACNFHSWSENGPWTPCCYTGDHARASCMWDKPRELTGYSGNGYEIASWSSGQNTPEGALSGWRSSPLHNAVIVNSGAWSRITWKAVGVGLHGSYAVVWFGEEADPCSK